MSAYMPSETMVSFAKNILKLEEMVETLVLEGLGVRGESIGAHLDMLSDSIRMWRYGAPSDTETAVTMQVHCDLTMVTAIVQHEVEGLEVHVGDGRWVAVPAEPGTFAFVAGDQLRVRYDLSSTLLALGGPSHHGSSIPRLSFLCTRARRSPRTGACRRATTACGRRATATGSRCCSAAGRRTASRCARWTTSSTRSTRCCSTP